MDRLSKRHRSWNMSQIRAKDTKPEMRVRSMLHQMGFRFRLHVESLPGHPDIVLPKHNRLILVHGCYWHRHNGCKYAYTPKSRTEFWEAKFAKNVIRDQHQESALTSLGWHVSVIWECETENAQMLEERITEIMQLGAGSNANRRSRKN